VTIELCNNRLSCTLIDRVLCSDRPRITQELTKNGATIDRALCNNGSSIAKNRLVIATDYYQQWILRNDRPSTLQRMTEYCATTGKVLRNN